MRVTHLTEENAFGSDSPLNTTYWISQALERAGVQLRNIHMDIPKKLLSPMDEFLFRCKKFWYHLYKRAHLSPDIFCQRALHIAGNVENILSGQKADVLLTSLTPIAPAFLETNIPIVYWTDAVFAALANFYPNFRCYHPDSMWDGHIVTEAALQNARLLVFSSQWAARTAVEFYGINRNKIKVVPFGANIDVTHNAEQVKAMIAARSKKCIKLLFVGRDWYRKGGDIVLDVTKALHAAGHAVELTIVGTEADEKPLPPYVKCEGLISKKSKEGLAKLQRLYQEAHFLFVPSRAEAYGIVFCEANAFGVPCLTTHVGGIPEIIKDGQNGMTFSLEATVQDYCDYIVNLMNNDAEYKALALAAFNEYETRLNWHAAGLQVKSLMAEVI